MESKQLDLTVISEQLQALSDKIDGIPHSLLAWSPAIVGLLAAVVALYVGRISAQASKDQAIISAQAVKDQATISADIAIKQIEETRTRESQLFRANSRRIWIEDLRKSLATFFSLANQVHTCLSTDDFVNASRHSEQLKYQIEYIELMLNPLEKPHQEFVVRLTDVQRLMYQATQHRGEKNMQEFVNIIYDARKEAKTILKTEWDRAKNLE